MSTMTETEKAARTPQHIDAEIARLHQQRPQLEEQVQDAARRCKEIETQLGDLFVRSLCDESQQPQAEVAALEQERQQAMVHAATLDRALGQFSATVRKLEAEKLGLQQAGKRAERDAVLKEQQALARDLDKLFEQSVMPKFTEFLQRANTLYGLAHDLGQAAGTTPKQQVARAILTHFGVLLHPVLERPSVRVSFSDSVPKR
jgi:phage shock protein A